MKKLTMLDIANEMNVSRSTVSRAINYESVVADEIAVKIRTKAKQMGYKFKKTRNAVSDSSNPAKVLIISPMKSNVYTVLITSLINNLISQGFAPEFICDSEINPERLKLFSGIILLHPPTSKKIIKMLKDHVCVQVLGSPSVEMKLDCVTYDNKMTGFLAAEWLFGHGSKNLVSLTPNNSIAEIRANAFCARAKELGCKTEIVYISSPEKSTYENVLNDIILKNPEVDGLFAFNDFVMLSFYPQVVSAGFVIGENMNLIACNAEPFLTMLHPRPATIDLHMEQMGKRATEILKWRLNNLNDQPTSLMLRPEIVEPDGDSLIQFVNAV